MDKYCESDVPKIISIEQLGISLPVNEQGTTNSLWVDGFRVYREFGKSIYSENTEELMAEHMFYNDNIKVWNKIVFYQKLHGQRHIYCIGNTMCAKGNFLSFDSLKKDAK